MNSANILENSLTVLSYKNTWCKDRPNPLVTTIWQNHFNMKMKLL